MARLAHHVFFTLKDNSPAAVDRLPPKSGPRHVTVKFDVSLHVIFRDRATHDVYQTAPRHLEFIERQKENWATVQVCDSLLED